jgi:hypothetical protein
MMKNQQIFIEDEKSINHKTTGSGGSEQESKKADRGSMKHICQYGRKGMRSQKIVQTGSGSVDYRRVIKHTSEVCHKRQMRRKSQCVKQGLTELPPVN